MSSTRSRSVRAKRRVAILTSARRGTAKSSQRERERSRSNRIVEGSGNVFVDIGFPPEEAINLSLRSRLMIELTERLKTLKITQALLPELESQRFGHFSEATEAIRQLDLPYGAALRLIKMRTGNEDRCTSGA